MKFLAATTMVKIILVLPQLLLTKIPSQKMMPLKQMIPFMNMMTLKQMIP